MKRCENLIEQCPASKGEQNTSNSNNAVRNHTELYLDFRTHTPIAVPDRVCLAMGIFPLSQARATKEPIAPTGVASDDRGPAGIWISLATETSRQLRQGPGFLPRSDANAMRNTTLNTTQTAAELETRDTAVRRNAANSRKAMFHVCRYVARRARGPQICTRTQHAPSARPRDGLYRAARASSALRPTSLQTCPR